MKFRIFFIRFNSTLTPTLSPLGRGSYSELGIAPSPLRGEGWGEGDRTPSPSLPPLRGGEGQASDYQRRLLAQSLRDLSYRHCGVMLIRGLPLAALHITIIRRTTIARTGPRRRRAEEPRSWSDRACPELAEGLPTSGFSCPAFSQGATRARVKTPSPLGRGLG